MRPQMKLGHAEFVDFASMFQLARRFWPYLAPLRLWIAVSVALSVALPLIGGAILWLIKTFVDNIIDEDRFSILPMLTAGFLLAAVAKVLVDFVAMRLEAWIAETIVYRLRADLYHRVVTLSPGSLGRHSTGDVLARLGSDVERAEVLLYTGPGLIVPLTVWRRCLYRGAVCPISWRLSLASLVVLPPSPRRPYPQTEDEPIPLRRYRPGIGCRLIDILLKCMSRTAAQRPSLAGLILALHDLIGSGSPMWPDGFRPDAATSSSEFAHAIPPMDIAGTGSGVPIRFGNGTDRDRPGH